MCIVLGKSQTIEEIIALNSSNMSDEQKCQYWWEISQTAFSLLGKVSIKRYPVASASWVNVAKHQFPSLENIKVPDGTYYTTSLLSLKEILSKDWTNLVKYVAEIQDCDDFAMQLTSHLVTFYQITSVLPVWGDTDRGYHAFNLAVLYDESLKQYFARLVEPQTDIVFTENGPLGRYIPKETTMEYGIKRREV